MKDEIKAAMVIAISKLDFDAALKYHDHYDHILGQERNKSKTKKARKRHMCNVCCGSDARARKNDPYSGDESNNNDSAVV